MSAKKAGKDPKGKGKGKKPAVVGLTPVNSETPKAPEVALEVQEGPGRPTKYKPEFVKQAEALCDLGATDEEMAAFFDVDARTVYRWKLEYPEFCQSIKAGKDRADDRVERSLFQKASGFYFKEEQAVKVKTGPFSEEVEVVPVEKYAPPDTTAMIFWLKNRRSANWRDKQEITQTTELVVKHRWGA